MFLFFSTLAGRASRVSLVASSIALLFLITARSAEADSYKMYTCNVPGVATPAGATAEPWVWGLDGRNTQAFDNCSTGGGFGISLAPGRQVMSLDTSAVLHLQRPNSGPKSVIGIIGYRTWLIAQLGGSGGEAFISDGGAFGPPGGVNLDADPWVSPRLAVSNPAAFVQLYCSGGAGVDCAFSNPVPLTARGVEVSLYETVAPTASLDGGTLLAGGARKGRETVSYTAADQESGVRRIEVLLGDTVVGSQDFEARPDICPHRNFNACAASQTGGFTVDTSQVPDGPYLVTLRVTDAAGNPRTIRGNGSVQVSNATTPASAIPTPAAPPAILTAGFAGVQDRTLTSTYGKSIVIRGRLTDGAGVPIPGAAIRVRERRTLPTARLRDKASVTTDTDGRYRYRLPRNATSRTIEVSYEPAVGGPASSATQTLQLRVSSVATLKVSLAGVSVRYSGRVLGTPIPRGGKTVFVQGRAAGSAWQTFAVRRTNESGRFSGRYRLRVRRPGVKLQFRVRIPTQTHYPYVAGKSRVVSRRVK